MRDEQLRKAERLMEMTEEGIVMEVMEVQEEKAEMLMVVTESGMLTEESEE